MQTSTPMGSPLRRKLSMKANLVSIEQDEEDVENELRNRRLEAINKSTDQKRRSIAAPLSAGLNAAQLAKHCKDCIKLSTENKINSKNAFSFLLIDFMAAMAKRSDSEISKNFQVATCTLDASVKIYGYRVDAVHAEAMKMAGGFFGKEMQEAFEDEEPGEGSDNGGNGDKEQIKVKAKKKKRKLTVVPAVTLNTKSESEALLDAAPKKTLLSRNADGSQLLTRVPKYNDGCLLMVDADVPCWPFDSNKSLVPKFESGDAFDPEIIMSLFREIPVNNGDKLCAAVSSVEFGRDAEEEPDLEMSQTSTFEFDVNASVPDADFDNSEAPARLIVPCGGYDSGEEIAAPQEAPKRAAPASVVDMKRRLSVQNMEYSMFDDKVLKAWAGPTYWKVRPTRESRTENKENEEASQAVGAKRTRRGRVKELAELFEVPDEVLARHLAPTAKSILAKATLCNWKAAAVTLAEDYKYSPNQLFTLFHLPLTVDVHCRDSSHLEDVLDDGDEEKSDVEELEYCSQLFPDDEPLGQENDEPGDTSVQEVETWDADNMVAVPNKVEKIAVGAFQRRKHVDMKHLKRCIWNILTEGSTPEDTPRKAPFGFQELLNTCPSKLSKTIKSCMSAPMLFNAVLHLTNERSLVLSQGVKGADFNIAL